MTGIPRSAASSTRTLQKTVLPDPLDPSAITWRKSAATGKVTASPVASRRSPSASGSPGSGVSG
jgi:hypothetical protein